MAQVILLATNHDPTPLVLPASPTRSSLAGTRSGWNGRMPPSVHVSVIGFYFAVALNFNCTDEDGGQPSGMYSGLIFLKIVPTAFYFGRIASPNTDKVDRSNDAHIAKGSCTKKNSTIPAI